jgi:hypothetical protein
MDVFTGNGVNITEVGILNQRDRTTMRKEIDGNGTNTFRIPAQKFSSEWQLQKRLEWSSGQ